MKLLFISQWFSESIIHTVGWTLLHSLWQGFFAAMLALVILWLTKKSSPLLRYNLLLTIFVVFILGVITTFSFQYKHADLKSTGESLSPAFLITQPLSEVTTSFTVIEQTKNYLSSFENLINQNLNLIVAIWLFIFCVQCIRLTSNLGYIYRIRNYKTNFPSNFWQQRCNQLKNNLGIRRTVSILESGIIKVPLVVGFFKPLILFPAGVLAQLPYNQIESILLHELAHIRRSDYLVNLLQGLVETIFFFNPAVIWISSLIKEEREACCDAVAVNQLNSKGDYIQALVSFQEYALQTNAYAMNFPGQRNSLLARVKRIINNENKKLNAMEKIILFCGIIAITSFTLLSNNDVKAQMENVKSTSNTFKNPSDTIPKNDREKNTQTNPNTRSRTWVATDDDGQNKTVVLEMTDENGREINARLRDNKIIELSVDRKKIDSKHFTDYENEVKKIIEKQRAEGKINKQKASRRVSESKQQSVQNEKTDIQKSDEDNKIDGDNIKLTYKKSGDGDAHKDAIDIVEILKENNIIKGKDGTTFKLDSKELLVNGIKQSVSLHQALKERYIIKEGDHYIFSSAGGTTDITVRRE